MLQRVWLTCCLLFTSTFLQASGQFGQFGQFGQSGQTYSTEDFLSLLQSLPVGQGRPPPGGAGPVLDALTTLAYYDDLRCVPRLLCEMAAGGRYTHESPLPFISKDSLIKLLTVLAVADASPMLMFGRAALLGVTARGDPRSCRAAYPTCPQDPDHLVHYLNNHRGGFFRLFGGPPADYAHGLLPPPGPPGLYNPPFRPRPPPYTKRPGRPVRGQRPQYQQRPGPQYPRQTEDSKQGNAVLFPTDDADSNEIKDSRFKRHTDSTSLSVLPNSEEPDNLHLYEEEITQQPFVLFVTPSTPPLSDPNLQTKDTRSLDNTTSSSTTASPHKKYASNQTDDTELISPVKIENITYNPEPIQQAKQNNTSDAEDSIESQQPEASEIVERRYVDNITAAEKLYLPDELAQDSKEKVTASIKREISSDSDYEKHIELYPDSNSRIMNGNSKPAAEDNHIYSDLNYMQENYGTREHVFSNYPTSQGDFSFYPPSATGQNYGGVTANDVNTFFTSPGNMESNDAFRFPFSNQPIHQSAGSGVSQASFFPQSTSLNNQNPYKLTSQYPSSYNQEGSKGSSFFPNDKDRGVLNRPFYVSPVSGGLLPDRTGTGDLRLELDSYGRPIIYSVSSDTLPTRRGKGLRFPADGQRPQRDTSSGTIVFGADNLAKSSKTMKFPSDNEESRGLDRLEETIKFPSTLD